MDAGDRRGETTITMKYFAIPAVSAEAAPAHDGTTTLPATQFERFVFGRGISRERRPHHSREEHTLQASRVS